jgi:protein-tyrosine phosphatase
MNERGLDLSRHESQPLSDRLIRFADVVFTMTRSHREAILAHWPGVGGRTFVLGDTQGDVADPIGGSADVYRLCAEQIEGFLRMRVGELDWASVLATCGLGG